MSVRLLATIVLAAALPVVTTHKDGGNDVVTTTWDYVDANGCHVRGDDSRATHLGTFVQETRTISRTCGTHTYTFHSTITATARNRSHKEEQSADRDPSTCSSLVRSESGDYERDEEVSGQRTIATIVDGAARPPIRAIIKNGRWVDVRTNGATQPPSHEHVCPAAPSPGEDGGYGSGGAILPPYAGPGSTIAFHVAPGEGGAQGMLVVTEGQHGDKRYERWRPDTAGAVVLTAAAGAALVGLVKQIDDHGEPDILSRTTIGYAAHIPGTDVVANPPSAGPCILESSSSAQPGDVIQLQIVRADPSNARLLLDGKQVARVGISDNSAALQIPSDSTLSDHELVLESGNTRSNALRIAIVKLTPEQLGPSSPGIVQTVKVHVEGLTANAQATMYFEVGGTAVMLDGGTNAAVPVVAGAASVQIRGTRTGQALLRFHLSVKNPQFVSESGRPLDAASL